MLETETTESGAAGEVLVATLSEAGPVRAANEDSCGYRTAASATSTLLVAVADGVSGYRAADVASETAVSVTLEAFDRQSGRADARLARAAQEANIAIYDRAMIVPELRGMATTLTAIAVERGQLSAIHVGDSRLYLVRAGRALQLTKDHRAGKTTLTRSVGRELICAIDKLTRPLEDGDVLVLCTDGVHNFLPDEDLAPLVAGVEPVRACRAILDAALARGADDNLTIAVVAPRNAPRAKTKEAGLGDRWRRFVARGR